MAKKEAGWNPTLLDLLKEKATIIFEDGFELSGDPAVGSIHTNLENVDPSIMRSRSYKLSIHGLEQALKAIMEEREKRDRDYQ